jgi:hypothetical protein
VNGTKIGTVNPFLTGTTSAASSAAYVGNYAEEITATIQYQLWANVLSRLEFRWDHVDSNAFGASSTGALMKDSDFVIAVNLIYQF